MRNVLFTGAVWVMYTDVARKKVRKASNCSLGDRLCSFAFPMFVGPIVQTIITPRRVLGGGRAVSAVRLGTAMDQKFLHDFVNKSELTKELSSVRTSGVGGHGAGTHHDGAASGRGEEGSHVSLTSTLEQLLPNYLNEDSGYVRYKVLAHDLVTPDMSQCAY